MFDGKFGGGVFGSADHSKAIVSGEARIDEGAILEGPCFIDAGAHLKKGVKIGAIPNVRSVPAAGFTVNATP